MTDPYLAELNADVRAGNLEDEEADRLAEDHERAIQHDEDEAEWQADARSGIGDLAERDQATKGSQMDQAMARARWMIFQYRDASPEHAAAQMLAVFGDLIADLELYAEALGYDLADVKSVTIMAKGCIKSEGKACR